MNKTKRSSPRASTSQKTQASRLSSLAIPIVVGLMVVAVIVGAILSLENRQPASAAVLGTLSVPVVTAQPRATTSIPFPNVPRISVQDTIKKLDKGQAILIDVRSKSSYDQSHAAGALSLPEEEVDARLNELPQDKEWILYCTWGQENQSARVAQKLMDQGYSNVKALLGGFSAWQQAGYALESAPQQ